MTTYAIGCDDSHSPCYYVANASTYPWVQIPTASTYFNTYQDAYNYIFTIGLPGDQIYDYITSTYVYTFPPLNTITFSPLQQSVQVGGQITLVPICADTTGRTFKCPTLTWTTTNSNIAAVSNGVVVGVNPGSATITCSTSGKSGICVVTVTSISTVTPTYNPTATPTYNPTATPAPGGGGGGTTTACSSNQTNLLGTCFDTTTLLIAGIGLIAIYMYSQ